MAYINRLTDINTHLQSLNDKFIYNNNKTNIINGTINTINNKLNNTINVNDKNVQTLLNNIINLGISTTASVNKKGYKGNIINNTNLNINDEVIFNIIGYKTSLLSYQDESILINTPITIYGSIDNIDYVFIGLLYPTIFIGSNETVRSAKSTFDMNYFNYIKIKNNSSYNYINVNCSIFSY